MAAIVTTVVTVVLLGVLIPIFQTTQAKSDQVREQLELPGRRSTTTRPRPKSPRCGAKLDAIPHVESVEFVSKAEALNELKADLGKEQASELLGQLSANPLPAQLHGQARRRRQPRPGSAQRSSPPGAERQAAADLARSSTRSSTASDDASKIEQVTSALKIVLTVITAAADRSPR